MQPLLESVLLRAYIKSLLVMQLCRVHVEPLVAVGLCPGYCSLSFSFIFKQKCVYLKMYHKNSPSSTNSFSNELCDPVLSEIKSSKTDGKFWINTPNMYFMTNKSPLLTGKNSCLIWLCAGPLITSGSTEEYLLKSSSCLTFCLEPGNFKASLRKI